MRVLYIAVKLDEKTQDRIEEILDSVSSGVSNAIAEEWDYDTYEETEVSLGVFARGYAEGLEQ
jgi:hypothetical protein